MIQKPEDYVQAINWNKCYIREFKTSRGLCWSILFDAGYLASATQELAIQTMYQKGGTSTKTYYCYSIIEVAKALENPIKKMDSKLNGILLSSRIIKAEGILNKIKGKKIPLMKFKNLHPEYFIWKS